VADDDRKKEERIQAIMNQLRPEIRRLVPEMPEVIFEAALRRVAIHRLIDEELRPHWPR